MPWFKANKSSAATQTDLTPRKSKRWANLTAPKPRPVTKAEQTHQARMQRENLYSLRGRNQQQNIRRTDSEATLVDERRQDQGFVETRRQDRGVH